MSKGFLCKRTISSLMVFTLSFVSMSSARAQDSTDTNGPSISLSTPFGTFAPPGGTAYIPYPGPYDYTYIVAGQSYPAVEFPVSYTFTSGCEITYFGTDGGGGFVSSPPPSNGCPINTTCTEGPYGFMVFAPGGSDLGLTQVATTESLGSMYLTCPSEKVQCHT